MPGPPARAAQRARRAAPRHATAGQPNNNFIWDGEVLATELDDQSGPRAFVHEPAGFEPVLQQQNGEVFVSVNDHLGMPKDLVSGDGLVVWSAAHSAYGKIVAVDADLAAKQRYGTVESGTAGARGTATPVASPFRLLGQVADEDAELGWTRFRCFDAEAGRWLSPDPWGVDGGFNLAGFGGAPTDTVDELGLTGNPHIHEGKQGKHVPGHNNFQPGKSELTHPDPQALLDRGAGTGVVHGNKEVVDFGEPIGVHVAQDGTRTPTSRGTIHYDSTGGAHIVPAHPNP